MGQEDVFLVNHSFVSWISAEEVEEKFNYSFRDDNHEHFESVANGKGGKKSSNMFQFLFVSFAFILTAIFSISIYLRKKIKS